ncbi:hypothetical protein F5Y13DRAFT_127646 [Hypoxylon sp. FL1857]|nr:hypothetical protein F5Y13DRAFT_127646 [Hypoxylon sp. FL1857]
MSAELALAIIATVDMCLKRGNELKKICSALKGAEAELEERTLRLENGWERCTIQLQFVKQIQHLMDDGHRILHERTLRMLTGKLDIATLTLKSLVKAQASAGGSGTEVRFVPRHVKYAFKKESLDEAIDALETWQRLSDPSWFLILRMNDRRVDDTLAKQPKLDESIPSTSAIRIGSREVSSTANATSGLTLPAAALSKMKIESILLCHAKIATSTRSDKVITYILDRIDSTESNLNMSTKKDVRDLARRLQHGEPQTFGLLNCKGFVEETNSSNTGQLSDFTMVFRIPPGLARPRSLRDYLINTKPNSLSHRFSIAQQLARSISYVHVFGFVHKNVRPETVLGFEEQGNETPSIFLLGFNGFRREEGRTRRYGDDAAERNLYRHPTRQGISPEDDFVMQHDIFSLGVCLLEIGLWQSFVEYDSQNGNPVLSEIFGIARDTSKEYVMKFLLTSAKERFVELARSELRECMGTRYSNIVETCLTCLDPDNGGFGDPHEFEDEDGIQVGVRYIEKVLQRLNALCV